MNKPTDKNENPLDWSSLIQKMTNEAIVKLSEQRVELHGEEKDRILVQLIGHIPAKEMTVFRGPWGGISVLPTDQANKRFNFLPGVLFEEPND